MKRKFIENQNVTLQNISIVEEYSPWSFENQIILCDADWSVPYGWDEGPLKYYLRTYPCFKGFILINDDNDTYFMSPSFVDHLLLFASWREPGFSVNGSIGSWIRTYLGDENYTVKADFKNHWNYNRNAKGQNVIGKINGQNHSKVSLIGAHSDTWW